MWNNKNNKKLFSFMSNLQTYYHFKLNFQKVDQHTGSKWFIHGTKRHKDKQYYIFIYLIFLFKIVLCIWHRTWYSPFAQAGSWYSLCHFLRPDSPTLEYMMLSWMRTQNDTFRDQPRHIQQGRKLLASRHRFSQGAVRVHDIRLSDQKIANS